MEQNHIKWIIVLSVVSALTLLTSLEHHSQISKRHGNIANIFTPGIALISLLLGGFISFSLQKGIREVELLQILKLLPINEQTVLVFLYEHGQTRQSELAPQTQLSKGAVSKIVSHYERRGLISRINGVDGYQVKLKVNHRSRAYQAAKRLPGLTEKNLLRIIVLIFLFGFFFSGLNSIHIYTLDHALRPEMYLLAMEFLSLGGLSVLSVKEKISRSQVEKTLRILPKDEELILREIIHSKTILQQDLVDKTGVYKMKVSRMMQKFEQAQVIMKKPYGNTNLITSKL